MIQQATIYVTKTDRDRLGNMIEFARDQNDRANFSYVDKLDDELKQAEVVPSTEISPDVVTIPLESEIEGLRHGRRKGLFHSLSVRSGLRRG